MLSIVHHIFHVGVDREVGRGQALYEDHTGGGKHQARCTETWECTGRWERGMLYTRTVQVEASIKPGVQRRRSGLGGGKGPSSIRGPYRWRQGVQRRRSGPGGGKGASSIRGPYRWMQASGQVYRDVGVDREVERGKLYTRTTQVDASIRPGVQRRGSVPGGGKGASSIRGPYRWRQASSQVYRDVGVDWGVGRGQALYEDCTGGGKHQARCTET